MKGTVDVIIGFDVTSPGMLWWLAAAGVPLVIHLLSRRRYREMEWAAMEYLLAALRASRRRMRLEQWLLLLVRTLIVALVVTAVAEPFLERAAMVVTPGQRTHRVLVIDGSFSMAYRPTDKTRFERAKEIARQIVEASAQGDAFSLVLMSDPPRAVVPGAVFDADEFLAEIDNLTQPHTSADLAATLDQLQRLLRQARRQYPRIARREVYFLTDLCRTGWLPADAATRKRLQRQARQLAETAALTVIDVGQSGAENVAVTSVGCSQSLVTTSTAVAIEAEVKNFGRRGRSRVPVALVVGGRMIRQQWIDLPPGGAVPVVFPYRFDEAGDRGVEVRVGGDRLEVDNHRWLVVPVRQAIRVLCVDGRPSAIPFAGATDYLVSALAPYDGQSGRSPVYPEVVPEGRLLEVDLDPYDCIFLVNVGQFTEGEVRALREYVERGGGLVFFLGDQVVAESYNRMLAGAGGNSRNILPARLGQLRSDPPPRLDPLDYRHPIVRPFRGHERAGLLSTPVARYFQLIVPRNSQARVVVALGNGDPLIVEHPVGRGRVVLVATSADCTWTLMPKWPSYVPLVAETLAFVVASRMVQQNVAVGDALGGPWQGPGTDMSLSIRRPDGRSETVMLRRRSGQASWSYSDTLVSGLYAVRPTGSTTRSRLFAVNVDPGESDLTKLSGEQLREEVWPGVPLVHQTTWEDAQPGPVAQVAAPSPISKWLLYGVLVLLFVETFLARRFGHPW